MHRTQNKPAELPTQKGIRHVSHYASAIFGSFGILSWHDNHHGYAWPRPLPISCHTYHTPTRFAVLTVSLSWLTLFYLRWKLIFNAWFQAHNRQYCATVFLLHSSVSHGTGCLINTRLSTDFTKLIFNAWFEVHNRQYCATVFLTALPCEP